MKVLKGFALGLLGFLLYISLSTFGLVYMLNSTLLNPDFVNSEIKRLDISAVVSPIIKDMLTSQVPSQFGSIASPLIDQTLTELKPWMNQQADAAVNSAYAYLLGKSNDFIITIQVDPAKETVRKNIRNVLQQLPAAMREPLTNQIEQQFLAQIPSTFTVDRSMLGTEGAAALQQAREIVGLFQTAYTWLIVLIIVLAIIIALIHRWVKGATRELGIIFLTSGILGLAGYFTLVFTAPGLLQSMAGIPAAVTTWLTQVINDLMTPLRTYNIALTVIGVVLLIASFVYPRLRPAQEISDARVGDNPPH